MDEAPSQQLVLVVTNSKADQQGLQTMLKNAGFESEGFDDAELALDRAMEFGFSLVIVDNNLQMMNGLDFCGRLRKLRSHRHTPIILVADRAMGHIRMRAQTLAHVTLLKKPVPEVVMLARVNHAMQVMARDGSRTGLGVGQYMDHDPNRG